MALAVLGMVLYGYFTSQALPRAPSTAGYTKLAPSELEAPSSGDVAKATEDVEPGPSKPIN